MRAERLPLVDRAPAPLPRAVTTRLRIDHFRAFVAWWGVPARRPHGAVRALAARARAPRSSTAARAQLGALSLVAEDLGVITAPVRALMARLGLPGMRVIQFAFEGGPGNAHRLENHVRHAVVYSGTHDNQTAAGWWGTASDAHATGGHGRRRRARASPASPRTG